MKITLTGTGLGTVSGMTGQARQALAEAQAVIGAPRLLQALAAEIPPGRAYTATRPEVIAQMVAQNPQWESLCILLSGDVGFYSGAAKLVPLLAGHQLEICCGISSVQALAARLQRPWQDFHLVSGHAGGCNLLAQVLNHPQVFFLTGAGTTPQRLCRELEQAGLGQVRVTVGENLGEAGERIVSGTPAQLLQTEFAPLCVILVENDQGFWNKRRSCGYRDEDFIRGQAPMTKREVRSVALSLLEIGEEDHLADVGAGTGSVAVEMSLLARRGRVFAIEMQAEAFVLLQQNRSKFGVWNMTCVEGEAPKALENLPTLQGAFIGGSKGQLREIVRALLQNNAEIRLVISAITLETLHQSLAVLQELGVANPQVCQIGVSRAEPVGGYHMMKAQNPIFLISGGPRRED